MRSRDLISIRYVTVWSRDLFSTNQSAVFSSSPQTPGSDCATGSDFATGSGCATGSDHVTYLVTSLSPPEVTM